MATTTPEADLVSHLSFKVAATSLEAPGKVEVHEDEGIVEAIVSITGIEDEVADVIEPGAYAETLTKRRPKVIWHHSWEQPIGRVLHIEELSPGDSRLPQQTKDGKQWPQGAGGLLATMQFNLKSERGKEAFEAVRFYSQSGECEWSIGYQVPPTGATRDKAGVRHIKSIELYEISFVLFGAASQTGTLGVKAAYQATLEAKRPFSSDQRAKMADRGTAMPDGSYPIANEEDLRNAIQAYGRSADKAAVRRHIIKRARALKLTKILPDDWDVSTKDAAVETEPETVPGPGTPPGTEPEVAPTPPEATPPNTEPVADPVEVDPATEDEVIATLAEHLALYTDEDWAEGLDELTDSDQILLATFADDEPEGKAITPGGRVGDASPVGEPGGRQNWVDKTGGLPRYIRMVAHALIRGGMSKQRAIATAVATMKRWAANVGGKVSAKVQAAAAAAVAQWERMKAQSRTTKSVDRTAEWNPWLERGEYASIKAVTPTGYQDFPKIEGTYEERLEAVRNAVTEALQEPYVADSEPDSGEDGRTNKYDYISIDGTWEDRVIATCCTWGDAPSKESYEMNYVLADDGSVTLSEPVPVKLTVYVEPNDGDPGGDPEIPMGDLMAVPETLDTAVAAAKSLLMVEQKAGRVISSINEGRLKGALESLIAILRAAGINLDGFGPVKPLGDDPERDAETTAPSANPGTKAAEFTRDDVAATLAALGID